MPVILDVGKPTPTSTDAMSGITSQLVPSNIQDFVQLFI